MNIPLIIGALAVSFFLITGLMSILKTSFKTALIIGLIVFGLQIGLKISPQQVFGQVTEYFGGITTWFLKWGNTNKPPTNFRDGKESMLWLLESLLS
jgi:hypothetical protein